MVGSDGEQGYGAPRKDPVGVRVLNRKGATTARPKRIGRHEIARAHPHPVFWALPRNYATAVTSGAVVPVGIVDTRLRRRGRREGCRLGCEYGVEQEE